MKQENASVLWNRRVGPDCYQMRLSCRSDYVRSTPGQFVMLRPRAGTSPLLPRPFSIHRVVCGPQGAEAIEILYKVVGCGTRELAARRSGDPVALFGPLGRGFHMPPAARRAFIVAGGIGVAPMVYLAAHLKDRGLPPARCTVFLGAQSRTELLCRDAFADLGINVVASTDDGSLGDACFITVPLALHLDRRPPGIIFACGPPAMLECVAAFALQRGIPCQVSLESRMACGFGVCLGCAVAGADAEEKYHHVCVDGPVFDVHDLLWPDIPAGSAK